MGHKVEHGRGNVNHNAMAALVTSPVYKAKAQPAKKGKGATYKRKAKHPGRDLG